MVGLEGDTSQRNFGWKEKRLAKSCRVTVGVIIEITEKKMKTTIVGLGFIGDNIGTYE